MRNKLFVQPAGHPVRPEISDTWHSEKRVESPGRTAVAICPIRIVQKWKVKAFQREREGLLYHTYSYNVNANKHKRIPEGYNHELSKSISKSFQSYVLKCFTCYDLLCIFIDYKPYNLKYVNICRQILRCTVLFK